MKNKGLGIYALITFCFIAMQVLLFNHFHVAHTGFCFLFLSVIISVSPKNGRITNLLFAFLVGITIDIFNNTLGVHTFCCLTVMFLRNDIYRLLSGKSYDEVTETELTMSGIGLYSFTVFITLISFFYSIIYFVVLAPKWVFMSGNFVAGLASGVFTSFMILLVNVIFFYKKKMA